MPSSERGCFSAALFFLCASATWQSSAEFYSYWQTNSARRLFMKKALCMLAVMFALTWASAQTSDASGQSSSSSGDQATHKGMHKGMHKGGAGTLTGCLSGPNDEGAYVLEHGSRKVEVGGNDELSKHVGHTVKLHGTWSSGSAIGEKESSETKESSEKSEGKEEKGERHFKVTSIDHVSDTCQAGAGAMGGHKHKMGNEKGGATPQPSPSPSPQ
jgi:hypothetical protein